MHSIACTKLQCCSSLYTVLIRACPVLCLPSSSSISRIHLDSRQHVLNPDPRLPGHDIPPNPFLNPLSLFQDTPVRTRLTLQPLEIIHLIPKVPIPTNSILLRSLDPLRLIDT